MPINSKEQIDVPKTASFNSERYGGRVLPGGAVNWASESATYPIKLALLSKIRVTPDSEHIPTVIKYFFRLDWHDAFTQFVLYFVKYSYYLDLI